jgi:hypothetical protein
LKPGALAGAAGLIRPTGRRATAPRHAARPPVKVAAAG